MKKLFYLTAIILTNILCVTSNNCTVGCECVANELNCSYSNISSVPPRNRVTMHNVTLLDMTGNSVVNLTDALLDYVELERLIFKNNHIKHIYELSFQGLIRLTFLDLSGNKIREIDNSFRFTPNLTSLMLNDNNIHTLGKCLFCELKRLKYTDISFNVISKIPDMLFRHNKELEHVSLRNNDIIKLTNNTFSENSKLKYLDISHNKIKTISSDIFNKLEDLKWLSLSKNNIETIHKNFFKKQQKLQHLNLSYNRIYEIKNSTFSNCKNLHNLYLENNYINKLDPQTFYGLFNLKYLDISHNNIRDISADIFTQANMSKCQPDKKSEYSLRYINLGYNNINSLDKCAFLPIRGIEEICLQKNSLQELKKDWFLQLQNLTVLDISFNNISSLDESITEFLNMNNINISFTNNPWSCECKSLYEAYKLTRKNITLQCAYPEDVKLKTWDILTEKCEPTTTTSTSTTAAVTTESFTDNVTWSTNKSELNISAEPLEVRMIHTEETSFRVRYDIITVGIIAVIIVITTTAIGIINRHLRNPQIDKMWWEDTITRKELMSEM